MSFLLDTVTVSESTKRKPNSKVIGWFQTVADEQLHLSALTIGEIAYGIERLSRGADRTRLEDWLEHKLLPWLGSRVWTVDEKICRRWASLRTAYPDARPIDALIASTALVHGFTVVTRNVKDFAFEGLSVFDPWNG